MGSSLQCKKSASHLRWRLHSSLELASSAVRPRLPVAAATFTRRLSSLTWITHRLSTRQRPLDQWWPSAPSTAQRPKRCASRTTASLDWPRMSTRAISNARAAWLWLPLWCGWLASVFCAQVSHLCDGGGGCPPERVRETRYRAKPQKHAQRNQENTREDDKKTTRKQQSK